MKFVSEDSITGGHGPTKIVYKRSWWSPRAALEAFIVTIVMIGVVTHILLTYDDISLHFAPLAMIAIIAFGGTVSLILGIFIYSMSKEHSFITAICKKYGYTLEGLAESIPDMEGMSKGHSRMLLPMSPNMPANVDIYVTREQNQIFVEEIHH